MQRASVDAGAKDSLEANWLKFLEQLPGTEDRDKYEDRQVWLTSHCLIYTLPPHVGTKR